jgi:hypothetical protein
VSYVAAQTITVRMKDGEVDVTEVTGLYRGVYLDPAAAATASPSPTPAAASGRE